MPMSCPRGAAILMLCTALLSGACRNIDVVTNSYATVAEARSAGAIDRGWMPPGLPAGAHDIREAHDLDSNRQWGLFSFEPADRAAMTAWLDSTVVPLESLSCDVPSRIEWWPLLLRGRLDGERVRATGLEARRLRGGGDLIVLVNWSQGRAYYWTADSGER